MIGFFIPILTALVAGYIAAVGVYMGLLFLVTRLGPRVLLRGGKASWVYTLLHGLAWGLTAAAGGYICCNLAPLPPYGLLGFPVCLAIALAFVLLRGFRQLRGQMSVLALILNLCCIISGTAASLYSLSVFKILNA